ncbi:oxidoreductase [Lithospermum erythrorhizon]|uniref:Oxidoreductase n=1 Tax=Lithospermum erythrorhizon TaxID=34254 RepID=A0AAV3QLN4_LITER
MALQVQAYKISSPRNGAIWTLSTKQAVVVRVGGADSKLGVRGVSLKVNSSLDGTASSTTPVKLLGQVTEVNKDTFWPLVNAAGDKTVVLDMFTQWCGPCKVIAPKYQELSLKYNDVIFLKLDCNQDNKPLAKELGIKVVPTFKILKDSKIVKEITGAKFDDLVAAIESVRSS